MDNVKRKTLSRVYLKNKEEYLRIQLKQETDILVKLDILQKITNNNELLRNTYILPRRRLRK